MKRPILISILVVVLVFCYCFWGLAPKEAKVAAASAAGSMEQKTNAVVAAPELSQPTSAAIQKEVPKLLTDERKRIMDSPSLMTTIADIRLKGTQDEKDWALFIMAACANVQTTKHAADASSGVPTQSSPATRPKDKEVAAQRQQAYQSLSQRCKGLFELSPEDRRSLRSDLIAGSPTNSSALSRLHALASTDENRWNDEQAGLITSALYSDDPLMQREGFYAMHGSIDTDAPGGADRSRAMERAFPPEVVSSPLSDFERLASCYVIKLCPSSAADFDDQAPATTNINRLEGEYKTALQAHKDVKAILAIH